MQAILEIGTEAIPAGYIARAQSRLHDLLTAKLKEAGIQGYDLKVQATPRRLAAVLDGLPEQPAALTETHWGPPKDIAFAEGEPTKAALGFAKKLGAEVGDLDLRSKDGREFLFLERKVQGRPTAEQLPEIFQLSVAEIEWPKTMKWNATGVLFPRPIRWILALAGNAVLPVEIAGVPSGRSTRGHRLSHPEPVEVSEAGKYEEAMSEVGVMLDPQARRASIEKQLGAQAAALGGKPVGGEDLFEEVTYLCEHPEVLTGSIDEAFLDMPREIVVTAMRSHQRYFAVEDEAGQLLPAFLVVCDGHWNDPATVRAGNERVLRARLADARFYWDVDLKQGLEAMAAQLEQVVWLESIGSLAEKTGRVAALVDWVGPHLSGQWASERAAAHRAATLSKADLASEMIKDGKEFTGLQGVVAARYAQALGEPDAVCTALEEQYLPRGAGDPLPETAGGRALALADRMDTIAGCFAAGLIPSGSQDPYALRRAANGIVRILMEGEHHLDLAAFAGAAVERLPQSAVSDDLLPQVTAFLGERIAHFLRRHGSSHDAVDAVLATGTLDPLDALARARALEAARGEDDLEPLVVGFKRAANILKGAEAPSSSEVDQVDWKAAEAPERDLMERAREVRTGVEEALKVNDYPTMLGHLLELRAPIDGFFDGVMVMSDVPAERDRRLALLAYVKDLFANFCDLSKVVIEGDASS